MNIILINKILDVFQKKIIPLTFEGVSYGNKIFGAAILKKEDFSLVVAGTNNEIENPLWHGEVHTLKKFYELPKKKDLMKKIAYLLLLMNLVVYA